jgi:hexulose-6-phosphate isomerase
MTNVGIMQGRLGPPEDGRFQSFPSSRWREEFAGASKAGLYSIEWIYDEYGREVNPIMSGPGCLEIVALSRQHGVKVTSVCADYFMDHPVVTASEQERAELRNQFLMLSNNCAKLGVDHITIPFVDASRIQNAEHEAIVVDFVDSLLSTAEMDRLEIHLETDLAPADFARLLVKLPSPLVKVNYDSGNSSSLGYKAEDEFAAYGERIGSVHIKDRIFRGGTVALGDGDADLPSVIRGLIGVGYNRDYILQVARGTPGDEVAWASHNVAYLRGLLNDAGQI